MTKAKLDFPVLNFYKYDDKLFEEIFEDLPQYIYKDAKASTYKTKLYKSFEYHNNWIIELIKQSNGKPVDGVSWYEVLGVSIYNRKEMIYYNEICRILHWQYDLAKLYFNSKYVKEDLLNLAKIRLEEILTGIEIPNNIKINYDYKETNSLYGNYRYFLGDVYISLYDTRTNIKSGSLSIIHIGQTYDDGYHSRPSWDCTYQNEQNIRHMVKQFLKDME